MQGRLTPPVTTRVGSASSAGCSTPIVRTTLRAGLEDSNSYLLLSLFEPTERREHTFQHRLATKRCTTILFHLFTARGGTGRPLCSREMMVTSHALKCCWG